MKKIIPFLAGLLCIAACNQLIEDPAVEPETSERITPTIIADSPSYSTSPSTRTEIHTITNAEDKEEIHTYWSKQDGLWVALCVDGMTTEPGGFYEGRWAFVTNNTQASQKATFTLNDDDPPFDGHTFYAIHPLTGDNVQAISYIQGSDEKFYSAFAFNIPVKQHPGAQTFDNDADLLVSESFSFDPVTPIVDGVAFTRMNAIVKINFVDKTDDDLFDKMGINAVTFGPKNGNKYLSGVTLCQPLDGQYSIYLDFCQEHFPQYYESAQEAYPAYSYVSAVYDGTRPSMGADGAYLLVYPTTLTNSDYPYGFPVQVDLSNDSNDYSVTRYVTLPEGGINLPAGLVTTLNISLYDDGINNTTIVNRNQEISFADQRVKNICLQYFDENEDGIFTMAEASRVKTLNVVNPGPAPKSRVDNGCVSPFRGNSVITSFDELQYFTGLESIESEAFIGCSGLTSIIIPEGISLIEENAFEGCSRLSSIAIPNSVTEIEEGAFNWCTSLASFTGKYASSDHKYLVCHGKLIAAALPELSGENYSIPSDLGIYSIGEYVFCGWEDLTSVSFPADIYSVGHGAFEGCTNLRTVSFPNSVSYLELAQEAFCWCTSLETINFPEGLYSIGWLAFQDCSSLTSISLPGSLSSMSDGAFLNCTGLVSVSLGDGMTSIGSRAFEGCSNLQSVSIPNSVKYINSDAFTDCTSLTSIVLPSELLVIGGNAFENCTGLTAITIPAKVTDIHAYAFKNCWDLINIRILCSEPPSVSNFPFSTWDGHNYITNPDLLIHVSSIAAYQGQYGWDVYMAYLTEQ